MARAGQQPPGRLPELVGTLRDLARVAGGARLTAGQDLRSLPVEIGVSLRDARTRYGLDRKSVV